MVVSVEGCCVWVWLERCRDGRYAVNASRCDVWVVCACLPVCIVACFVGFWGSVFAGSASLHDWFLHFLESAFSVTCFGAFFWGDGMKGFGVLKS